ncbi:MAG TPA: glucokinase, partial [Pseudomonadales bacterium]|nr:glucokinase [Pseudomonadales bacterium]
MILTADIGGTKTEFAVFKQGKYGLKVQWQQRYASADYVSFNALCAQLCKDLLEAGIRLDALKQASFAVAGPI